MGLQYVNNVIQYLDKYQFHYELLDELNITDLNDYHLYFILIEGKTLYVLTAGKADQKRAELFFNNLKTAAEKRGKGKLSFIMDASHLLNMPASVRNEIDFFDLKFRKYWDKVFFVYSGFGKAFFDMYELHKPEQLNGMLKLPNSEAAIMLATKTAHDLSDDKYLNSLSKDALIDLVKQQNIQTSKNEYNSKISELFKVISDISWGEQNIAFEDIDNSDVLSSVYAALNTALSDVYELKQELNHVKAKFTENLKSKLGEKFQQEASLRAIFDSLDSIVWFIDTDFTLLAYNNGFSMHVKEMYGLKPHVGMKVLEQKELASHYKSIQERMQLAFNGIEKNYRDFYRNGDQINKVVDSKIFPVVVNKKISGVACLTNDVTDHYFAKEKIKSNERIIASVNKNISEAIYRSSHELGLVFINEAFVKMFGYNSKEEIYSASNLSNLYANPDDRARLGKMLSKKKQVTNVEVQFRKKDGTIFTGLLSSMLTSGEDDIHYFDGAIRDVTAIKSAQEKLKKQNRELKKLNSELDSFVYSASHDLKAPLSSVKGLVNLAKQEEDKQQLHYYLDLVDKSVSKLDAFIKDIVDLSRNARQELKSETIDFDEIIEETLENYKYLENFDQIEKIISIKQDEKFYSDKRRLKVIFNNIVSNAIRYFNPYIDNPWVKIAVIIKQKHATIKISDNGLGIDEKYVDRIFEMFFRASNNSKGTGIGLYIVKETVEKLRGEIQVISKKDNGSIFEVKIPNFIFK